MNVQKNENRISETIHRIAEIISDEREMRQRCDVSYIIVTWNVVNRCKECGIRESSNNAHRENGELVNEVEGAIEENKVSEVIINRKQRCREIKIKGRVTKTKNKEIMRLFSENCNGFGLGSNDKIDQVIRESKS